MANGTKRATLDQIVAANIRRARLERGWTLQQTADRLAPYLGRDKYSGQAVSQAEGSAAGERTRNFSTQELYAFCSVFRRPAAWFLAPPDEWTTSGRIGYEFLLDIYKSMVEDNGGLAMAKWNEPGPIRAHPPASLQEMGRTHLLSPPDTEPPSESSSGPTPDPNLEWDAALEVRLETREGRLYLVPVEKGGE